jgi:protein dithiol oxidoreductase (disulfide-forming)
MARLLIASLLLLVAAGAYSAGEFREGEHYQVLQKPLAVKTPGKIEVVELFWYGCPHCFHFEPLISQWLKTKPEDVEFRRVPALFAENWVPHARAFFAADALGQLENFHSQLFKAIHADAKPIMDETSLINFAAQAGLPSPSFREAYTGFAIDGKVKQAMAYTKESGISGVPAVIVNGKYRTGAQMAGGQDKVMAVVNFLIEKERVQ